MSIESKQYRTTQQQQREIATAGTIIIGGGQAGLSLSYYLTLQQHPHVVLEKAKQAANAWRNDRWDSFTLVTPTVMSRLPGTEAFDLGQEFLPREKIIAYFEEYIRRFNLPVRFGVGVTSVEATDSGYRVTTDHETLEAANVAMATGLFQHPKVPGFCQNLPAGVVQLHSGQYRNPGSLPPGAVMVVGSGQSGCQIAEELYLSGRKVYLCISGAIRAPRRYRGDDMLFWLQRAGFIDRTPDMLSSPKERFAANPHVSGTRGGHTLNLHQFARDGVSLLGHVQDIQGEIITLMPDLKQSLAKADKGEADLTAMIDGYIERKEIDAPAEELPQLCDGYEIEEILDLNLKDAGITTVIWATGYRFDFSLVKMPVFDVLGFPIADRGRTASPGLYFVGLPWIDKMKTGLLAGVGEHAAFIAEQIGVRA